jgi:hypothetical protein
MPVALHVLEQQTLDQPMARRIALLYLPLPPALQIKQIILHAKFLPLPLLMLSAMRVMLKLLGRLTGAPLARHALVVSLMVSRIPVMPLTVQTLSSLRAIQDTLWTR